MSGGSPRAREHRRGVMPPLLVPPECGQEKTRQRSLQFRSVARQRGRDSRDVMYIPQIVTDDDVPGTVLVKGGCSLTGQNRQISAFEETTFWWAGTWAVEKRKQSSKGACCWVSGVRAGLVGRFRLSRGQGGRRLGPKSDVEENSVGRNWPGCGRIT